MRVHYSALVASFLIPSIVAAQEPPSPSVVTYPPGDDKIVVVHKGDPTPFTGQLFDDNTAVRWAVWLQQYKGRYAIDLKAVEDSCTVNLAHEQALAGIAADRDATVYKDAVARLKVAEQARLDAEEKLRNPSFFDRPSVWFGIGIGATVLTVVATAYLVNATSK